MVKRGWILAVICSVVLAMCFGVCWTAEVEDTENEVMKSLQEEYEWSMVYIRALVLMNKSLHAEKNLEALTRLHEKLISNKSISYTEEDYYLNYERNNFVDSITEALLQEFKRERKSIMTEGGGLLPWIKARNDWFDIDR